MKYLLLTFLLSFSVNAAVPANGLYICKQGNEESICDQQVKVFSTQNRLTAISVEYVGWCGSMGPYLYYCVDDICEDAGIKFEIHDSRHYRWVNKQYGFVCEFEKK